MALGADEQPVGGILPQFSCGSKNLELFGWDSYFTEATGSRDASRRDLARGLFAANEKLDAALRSSQRRRQPDPDRPDPPDRNLH